MKLYILLLCFPMVLGDPATQHNKTLTPLSDEAVQYIKSMPSKFDGMVSKLIEDLRKVIKKDLAAQVVLAQFRKPFYLRERRKLTGSVFAKTVMREGRKYDALVAHLFGNNPLNSLQDLAHEHPGVQPDLSDSLEIKSVARKFSEDVLDLIREAVRLTKFDKYEETLSQIPGLSDENFSAIDLNVFNYYWLFKVPTEDFPMDTYIKELIMKKYLVDNGLLK